MFQFDLSQLPQLVTRKALLGIDVQRNFSPSDPSAALPVSEPQGWVSRTASLAQAFRAAPTADLIWVTSKFEKPRKSNGIIIGREATEKTAHSDDDDARDASSELEVAAPASAGAPDEEAFLSHKKPTCAMPDSDGYDLIPDVQPGDQRPADLVLSKSHYSAFEQTQLLHLLRAKLIVEVFVCGSLANVGIFATALDAAMHGIKVTIVEDCCAYRDRGRRDIAQKRLVELMGCDVVQSKDVIEGLRGAGSAVPAFSTSARRKSPPRPLKVDELGNETGASDLTSALSEMKLEPATPPPNQTTLPESPSQTTIAATGEADNYERLIRDGVIKTPPLGGNVFQAGEPRSNSIADVDHTSDAASTKAMSKSEKAKQRQANKEDPESYTQSGLCEGDTDIIEDILPPDLEKNVFEILREEVAWQRMSHQGGEVPRLVAVQGAVAEDGSMPIYRHPSDESPPLRKFSPTVLKIKTETEKKLGHPLNHVLIQMYRDGHDYISEHSDKTLDIVKGSYIANVSLGAQRTMVFRGKRADRKPAKAPLTDPSATEAKPPQSGESPAKAPEQPSQRRTERARLPHNSLCRMGPATNTDWLHSIRQDKRAERDKTPHELAFAGQRISLTFRHIGTFMSANEKLIWGQGATSKKQEGAKEVINGSTPEAIAMLKAFGKENQTGKDCWDWDATYGPGFDVVHITSSPRFFVSGNMAVDLSVAWMLSELGIGWAKGSLAVKNMDIGEGAEAEDVKIKFVDNDATRAEVHGHMAILLYLQETHPHFKPASKEELARSYARLQEALALQRSTPRRVSSARSIRSSGSEPGDGQAASNLTELRKTLAPWNTYAKGRSEGYIAAAGQTPWLPDYVFWPVLHALVEQHGPSLLGGASAEDVDGVVGSGETKKRSTGGLDALKEYYTHLSQREGLRLALQRMGVSGDGARAQENTT